MSQSSRHRFVHKSPQKLDEVRNEINVTPLVDVCLVMLIIFMVIGPMMAKGKEVALPETENKEDAKDREEPVVAIDKFGKLYVDKDEVASLAELEPRLRAEWDKVAKKNATAAASSDDVDRSGEVRVLLKVDREVTYGKAYPVIMALHEMGAQAIDLGTAEEIAEGSK